jgi:hypothetical protein
VTSSFEHHTEPLLPVRHFVRRLYSSTAWGLVMIAVSLAVGMLGYHAFEGLSWIDAFDNAAMLLGGMGPVTPLQTFGGKLFAGIYALYCGFAVLVIAGVIFAPVVHRFLHHFHLEAQKRRAHRQGSPSD